MRNQLGNMIDRPSIEQTINDAKYARMKFLRKNVRLFVCGSGFLGLFYAFAVVILSAGSTNHHQ